MPINLHTEKLLSFADLAKSLPRRRRGRPVHVATIHRWRSPGLRGIRLEAVRIGGAWVTSNEAFARFVSRLTAASEGQGPVTRTSRKNKKTHDDIDAELSDDGW